MVGQKSIKSPHRLAEKRSWHYTFRPVIRRASLRPAILPGGMGMSGSNRSRMGIAVLGAGLLALTVTIVVSAQAQRAAASPQGYITGTVQGEKGPEAGVWVIAETK